MRFPTSIRHWRSIFCKCKQEVVVGRCGNAVVLSQSVLESPQHQGALIFETVKEDVKFACRKCHRVTISPAITISQRVVHN